MKTVTHSTEENDTKVNKEIHGYVEENDKDSCITIKVSWSLLRR